MGRHSYEVNAESNASTETVFDVLANGAGWREWAGAMIRHSSLEREGSPPPDGVGAIKRLGAKRFFSREETTEYDRPHRYGYSILSGQPVRDYKAIVDLTPRNGGTAIRWTATFDPKIPGTGALLAKYFAAIIRGVANRLAKHAERVQESGKRSTTS